MKQRKTVTFNVKVERLDRDQAGVLRRGAWWLKSDGGLTREEADGVRFTFYRSPTPVDRHQIEMAMHELAGGLEKWLDLEAGIESTRQSFIAELEARLWPEGRPEAKEQDLLDQQDQIAREWDATDSDLRRGLAVMLSLRDRLRFLASWPVLVKNPPAGWENIAERDDIDEDLFQAVWNAYADAVNVALLEQPRSSAP